jgi:hypothetical protein
MNLFKQLDTVLRGDALRVGATDKFLDFAVGPMLCLNALLAAVYGVCMGAFAVLTREEPEWRQMLASALKVPLLFIITLLVTFPSLYVFSTILGSRLKLVDLVRILTAGLSVLVTVLCAFGPIVAFFSASTTSYSFILLLNLAVFTASGLFGVTHLYRGVSRASQTAFASKQENTDFEYEDHRETQEAQRKKYTSTQRIFVVWILVFGIVGAQSGWILRPFVGSPDLPFTWFRPKQGSFFEGAGTSLRMLFGWTGK